MPLNFSQVVGPHPIAPHPFGVHLAAADEPLRPLPRRALAEGGDRQLPRNQKGLGREILHVFCSWTNGTPRPLGKRRHSQSPNRSKCSRRRIGLHRRTGAMGSEISKMERIDFRHQGWNHYFIERSAVMPAKINVVCALRALSFLPHYRKLPSAHSELLRGGQS